MNSYSYDELAVGTTESFSVTVTADMMDKFRAITGDVNPLHCDEGYARARGYSGRVVYGMLTSSMYSTLAGVYLPGELSLLYSVDTKLRKPVFIGDTLRTVGVVAEKSDVFHLIKVKAYIENQNGEKVSKAVLEVGIRQDEQR